MRAHFKMTSLLLSTIRTDLRRPHAFAHERVGFISAGMAAVGGDILIIARSYRPVFDDDYIPDSSVGVMMGPDAIRKALEWAMIGDQALFHVHTHGGVGLPGFSGVDIRENAKFVPDFLKVAPRFAHGALVLSDDAACGQLWLKRGQPDIPITEFTEVGAPIRTWSGT